MNKKRAKIDKGGKIINENKIRTQKTTQRNRGNQPKQNCCFLRPDEPRRGISLTKITNESRK